MSSPAKAHEPTMEEILASIRRIISDDESETGAARDPDSATGITPIVPAVDRDAQNDSHVQDGSGDDVLDLTDPIPSTESPDVTAVEPPPPPPQNTPSAAPAHPSRTAPATWPSEGRLLSAAADSAASSAFGALAHTIVTENARTLEDIVHEMLRPMLKSWLDDNLPALVERLVRQEIERVSRGRR